MQSTVGKLRNADWRKRLSVRVAAVMTLMVAMAWREVFLIVFGQIAGDNSLGSLVLNALFLTFVAIVVTIVLEQGDGEKLE